MERKTLFHYRGWTWRTLEDENLKKKKNIFEKNINICLDLDNRISTIFFFFYKTKQVCISK